MSSLRDDVLARTDIVDLVSKYVDIKKKGKNRMGLCPFHKEKSPSFTVAEDKQIFKCFGCGKGGNAFTFHMEMERIDFRDSLQMLAKDANIEVSSYQKDPEKQAIAKSEREKQKLMNKRTLGFFEQSFPGSAAETYVKDARKLSDETIKTFGIGYAPNSYDAMMNLLRDKGFSDQDIIEAGLAKAGKSGGGAYAFFRHRLTFPIHDHIGNVVGFGARALDPDQNPKYLNTTETALYNKSQLLFGLDKSKNHLSDFDQLIVVEGYMDVVALHQYGLPIGIATCGTALTTQHCKVISRYTQNLLFAFDNDKAGFEAAIRGLKVAYEQDLFPKILEFPSEYKDVDEWLVATAASRTTEEDSVAGWKEALGPLSTDGFLRTLEQYSARYDMMNPVERKKVINNCFEMLSKIEDYAIMQMYFSQLAAEISVHEEQLRKQFRQRVKKSSIRKTTYQKDEPEKVDTSSKIAERYLLAGLVHDTFAIKLGTNTSIYAKYEDVLKKLAGFFPQTILAEVYSGTISDATKEQLDQAELFRENQVAGLDETKVTAVIQSFLHQQIYKLQRVVMKSKTLTHEDKQGLLAEIRAL